MTADAQTGSEWRAGWPVVLAALAGVTCGLVPVPFYTLGLFAPHLRAAWGWTQGEVMAALSVVTLVSLAAAPVIGLLVNRLGARRVALTSLPLFGVGMMLPALNGGSLWGWYASFAGLAVLGAGTLPITWTRAVTAAFARSRGLALGAALMGTGLFGFLGKPFTGWAIAAFGWRGGFVTLGLLPILVGTPLVWALFRAPGPVAPGASAAGARAPDLEPAVVPGRWRLWLLAAALLPISFALAGPIPNLELILAQAGMAPMAVARVTPFVGLAALVGRLAGGWLADRVWAPGLLFLLLCPPAAALALLAAGQVGQGGGLACVLAIGFAVGVEYDLVAYLVARYFPARRFAPLYGISYTAFLLGAGFAPMLFGWGFDRWGSFSPVLAGAAVGLILGGAALLLLGPYPEPA